MPRKETKTLVGILILFNLGAIIFAFFIYFFTNSQISETFKEENQIKNELIKKDTAFIMKNDIKYGKNYEERLNSYILGKDDIAILIKTIEDLAASSSVKSEIRSIDYEISDKYTPLEIELVRSNVNVSGSWKNIRFFLNYLENYPLKIDIRNIVINNIPGGKIPQWSADFEFTVAKFK